MSSAAAAHLEQAERGHEEDNNRLPAHIARAQAARPKLTVLEGAMNTTVAGLGEPLTLLSIGLAQLKRATFRGGDAVRVTAQLQNLEWVMRMAMVRHESVTRYGAGLASARRKSVFDRMSRFRRSIWESSEPAPAAPPASEPVHNDNQLSQAHGDDDAARQRSPRVSFLQDAREAQERQSVRRDQPGRLNMNRPKPKSALEGEFSV